MSSHADRGRSYVVALVVLAIATGASWALSHVDTGGFHPVIALGIATIKAGVVALVFMHLGRAATGDRLAGVVTVLFIALICLGIAADVAVR